MHHNGETFDRYDSADYVNTFDDVVSFLEALIDEADDDPRMIAHALGVVARSQNFSAIAQRAGMSGEGLYEALSPDDRPTLSTVIQAAHALEFRLRLEGIA